MYSGCSVYIQCQYAVFSNNAILLGLMYVQVLVVIKEDMKHSNLVAGLRSLYSSMRHHQSK